MKINFSDYNADLFENDLFNFDDLFIWVIRLILI